MEGYFDYLITVGQKVLNFLFQSSSSTLAPFILSHTQAPKFMCKEKNFSYLRQQTIP